MEAKIGKLRYAVTCAVKYWKQINSSKINQIINLRKDILNSPHHIFGDHAECVKDNKAFCAEATRKQKLQTGEVRIVQK